MNKNIIPIFKTHGSIGRSILTAEDNEEIKDNSPVSIITIARKYRLKQIIVIDNSFVEFPKLYNNCNKHNIHLIFGIDFTICNDVKERTDDARYNECKISILMKNSDGYKDFIKLHDAINAHEENFYYISRGDWSILKQYMTDNLLMIIPPCNSFLEKNILNSGKIIPDFGKVKPIFTYTNIELPYTRILNPAIQIYAKNNGYECLEVWPIRYYKEKDFKAFCCYRAINNRSFFNSPDVDYLCSNQFSFESYLRESQEKYVR